MSGVLDGLTPEERSQWDAFVDHFRREQVAQIAGSAMFLTLVPESDGDVAFWAQLGCAIMLDKPIVALAVEGRDVPAKLRAIADEVVEADIDTDDGAAKLTAALRRVGA